MFAWGQSYCCVSSGRMCLFAWYIVVYMLFLKLLWIKEGSESVCVWLCLTVWLLTGRCNLRQLCFETYDQLIICTNYDGRMCVFAWDIVVYMFFSKIFGLQRAQRGVLWMCLTVYNFLLRPTRPTPTTTVGPPRPSISRQKRARRRLTWTDQRQGYGSSKNGSKKRRLLISKLFPTSMENTTILFPKVINLPCPMTFSSK